MIAKNNSGYGIKLRSAGIRLITIWGLIGILGFAVFPHNMISWDEEATLKVLEVNRDIVAGRKDYYTHLEYYGTLFHVAAEVLDEGRKIVTTTTTDEDELLVRMRLKHRFNFVVSWITYGVVAALVAMVVGLEFAWLGPLVLLLIPRFWGHGFFNSKDIPLAMTFTLGTLLGAYLIRYFHRQQRSLSLGLNKTTAYSILYGIVAGCSAAVRIDSSVLILFVPLVDIVLRLQKGDRLRQILRFGQFYAVMLVTCCLTILALYPASWSNPLGWYLRAFNFYYQEDWPHTVLFNGSFIPAKTLPWQYLPTWIGITVPVAIILLFFVGLILAVSKYRQFSIAQRACLLLIGLQLFGLPTFAILYRATLFDALRQVLYILPAIAAIAAVAIAWLYQMLRPKIAKLVFVGGLIVLALPIVIDMVQLHPYEYTYFNRAFGSLPAAVNKFETDYWGLSMSEAVTWLNKNREPAIPLVSSEPSLSARLLVEPDLSLILYDEFEPKNKPFYYLALPRWQWEQRFAQCPTVYSVTRQQAPLSVVKQCR